MSPIDFGGIIVAIVAALGAWAAQRSAAKASNVNTVVASRLEAEKEAYERARTFDVQTIERQDAEIAELRKDNENLRNELKLLTEDNRNLRQTLRMVEERLALLERKSSTLALEELLRDRLKDTDDPE